MPRAGPPSSSHAQTPEQSNNTNWGRQAAPNEILTEHG